MYVHTFAPFFFLQDTSQLRMVLYAPSRICVKKKPLLDQSKKDIKKLTCGPRHVDMSWTPFFSIILRCCMRCFT